MGELQDNLRQSFLLAIQIYIPNEWDIFQMELFSFIYFLGKYKESFSFKVDVNVVSYGVLHNDIGVPLNVLRWRPFPRMIFSKKVLISVKYFSSPYPVLECSN